MPVGVTRDTTEGREEDEEEDYYEDLAAKNGREIELPTEERRRDLGTFGKNEHGIKVNRCV